MRMTSEAVKNLLQAMTDAETGERGYVITGNITFLQPYHAATFNLNLQIAELDNRIAASPELAADWAQLRKASVLASEFMKHVIETRQQQGFESAVRLVESGEGKNRMDSVRKIADVIVAKEEARLEAVTATELKEMKFSKSLLIVLTVLDIALFGIAFLMLSRALSSYRKTQATLQTLHSESVAHSQELAHSQISQGLQNRLVNILQSSVNMVEAYCGIERYCAQIFHANDGAFYIRRNSKDYYERVAAWGDGELSSTGFEPLECWSARNGNIYRFDSILTDLPCQHFGHDNLNQLSYLCIPMNANGELTGILVLFGRQSTAGELLPVSHEVEQLASEVMEKIGLAIANLRLRDTLRHNSIIDSLTGLYNRRYMEETLRREISRAERVAKPIGVMMLDADHFKRFNDTHGHDAGDLVLREIAQEMKNVARKSDFACRFGGEEFILVMPEADEAIMLARAQALQQSIRKMTIMYGGQCIGPLTVSIGVAVFPEAGNTGEQIVKAADEALYQAKQSGRDRIVLAQNVQLQRKAS